jgi:hypothetical protein
MKANIKHRVQPVEAVPIFNINAYVRVPGMPPTPLSKALQEWPRESMRPVFWKHQDSGDEETRTVRGILVQSEEGEFKLIVNERVYETALYTLAVRRFGDWLRVHAND